MSERNIDVEIAEAKADGREFDVLILEGEKLLLQTEGGRELLQVCAVA